MSYVRIIIMEQNIFFSLYDKERHKSIIKKQKCFYPGCEKCRREIINSHTIQHRGSLSQIAEDGHIFRYIINPYAIEKYEKFGYVSPDKVGINKASTIPAFCKYHDNMLFRVIEHGEITPTAEQLCIFTFRALTYEIFMKKAVIETSRNHQNLSDTYPTVSFYEQMQRYEYMEGNKLLINGWEIALKELETDYKNLAEMITQKKYSDSYYLLFKTNQIPQVQCTGYFNPSFDLNGNQIQDFSIEETKTENISLTVFSNSDSGYILFTWPVSVEFLEEYILSIVTQKNLSNVLVSMIFSQFENHAFKQSWWESLSHIKKKDLCNKAFRASDSDYDEQGNIFPLKIVTHLKYVDWQLVARTNNMAVTSKLDSINFPKY